MVFFNLIGAGIVILAFGLFALLYLTPEAHPLNGYHALLIFFITLFLVDIVFRFKSVKNKILLDKGFIQTSAETQTSTIVDPSLSEKPPAFLMATLFSLRGGHVMFLPVWLYGAAGFLLFLFFGSN